MKTVSMIVDDYGDRGEILSKTYQFGELLQKKHPRAFGQCLKENINFRRRRSFTTCIGCKFDFDTVESLTGTKLDKSVTKFGFFSSWLHFPILGKVHSRIGKRS